MNTGISGVKSVQWILLIALACGAGLPRVAKAQQVVPRTFTFVVPFAAGGPMDVLARILSANLEQMNGQKAVVDFRLGAGGYIGAESVSRAKPDGQTLLVGSFNIMQSNLFQKDIVALSRVMTPVASLGFSPFVLLTPSGGPGKDLKSLLEQVRAQPGKFNIAVAPGTTAHLDALLFLKRANIDMAQIPYNGVTPTITALLRNEVQLYIGTYAVPRTHVQEGRMIALAVASPERYPVVPDVPTTRELGIPFSAGGYFAVFGPANMAPDLVNELNKTFAAAMNNPVTRERLLNLGMQPMAETPVQLRDRLDTETRDLAQVAVAAGIKPQ